MKLRQIATTLLLALVGSGVLAGDEVVTVVIKDYKFIPQDISIKPGQTIRWENQEKRQYHSVWFQALGEEEPADYLFPDDSYERRFDATGTFPYRCGPHPEMTGNIIVAE